MKKKRFVKNTLGFTLGATQVVVDAASVLKEMNGASLGIKILACVASSVEGDVYKKNISEGLSLFSMAIEKNLLKRLIIKIIDKEASVFTKLKQEIKEIEDFLKENSTDEPDDDDIGKRLNVKKDELLRKIEEVDCNFIRNYSDNKHFLEHTNSRVDASKIKEAEKRLKILRKFLVKIIFYGKNKKEDTLHTISELSKDDFLVLMDINAALFNNINAELSTVPTKLLDLRLSILFSCIAGIALGVVIFFTFPAVLTGLGIVLLPKTLTILMGLLALLSTSSSITLTYNSLAELIIDGTVSAWWQKLNEKIKQSHPHHRLKRFLLIVAEVLHCSVEIVMRWVKKKPHESWVTYLLTLFVTLTLFVILVVTTVTIPACSTAYTYVVQLLAVHPELWLAIVIGAPILLAEFIFSLQKTFVFTKAISKALSSILPADARTACFNFFYEKFEAFKIQLKQENPLQNTLHLLGIPLQILYGVFKLTLFILHLYFGARAADQFPGLPTAVTISCNIANECAIDLPAIFKIFSSQHVEGGHDHDHDHGGITDCIAKVLLFLPVLLIAVLDYVFSQANRLLKSKYPVWKVLGFREAFNKWDPCHKAHSHDAVDEQQQLLVDTQNMALSDNMKLLEIIRCCNKEIARLEHAECDFFSINRSLAREKREIFQGCKLQVETALRERKNISVINITTQKQNNLLAMHRHRFFRSAEPSKSMQQLNEIKCTLAAEAA